MRRIKRLEKDLDILSKDLITRTSIWGSGGEGLRGCRTYEISLILEELIFALGYQITYVPPRSRTYRLEKIKKEEHE